MKTQTMAMALMVILVLMAGIQAFQINQITDTITSGAITATSSTGSAQASSSGDRGSVLSSLPTQVGGCG